jgi:WD40 repeat protein
MQVARHLSPEELARLQKSFVSSIAAHTMHPDANAPVRSTQGHTVAALDERLDREHTPEKIYHDEDLGSDAKAEERAEDRAVLAQAFALIDSTQSGQIDVGRLEDLLEHAGKGTALPYLRKRSRTASREQLELNELVEWYFEFLNADQGTEGEETSDAMQQEGSNVTLDVPFFKASPSQTASANFAPLAAKVLGSIHETNVASFGPAEATNLARAQGECAVIACDVATECASQSAFAVPATAAASDPHAESAPPALSDGGTGPSIVVSEECTMTLADHSVATSSDDCTVPTGSEDKTARLWDCDRITSVAISMDGRTVVTGSDRDKTARLWDTARRKCTATLEGHSSGIHSVAISADGRTVVTGSDDQTARLWDIASGQCTMILGGHSDRVSCVAVSTDGGTAVTGSRDATALVWDVASGQRTATLEGHSGEVNSVAISADGRTVAMGSNDATARVWDIASGQCTTLRRHSGMVNSVAISVDGRMVVTGSIDGTARLWDVASGQFTATLEGHSDTINSVAISADGRTVATGSDDKTARLWDVASGQCVATLAGHSGIVSSVAISADGQMVATGSHDKTARVWDVVTGRCLASLAGACAQPLSELQRSVMLARQRALMAATQGFKTTLEWMEDLVATENNQWELFSAAYTKTAGAAGKSPELVKNDVHCNYHEAKCAYVHAINVSSSAIALEEYSRSNKRWMVATVEFAHEAMRMVATWQARAENELTRVLELVQRWQARLGERRGQKDEPDLPIGFPAASIHRHLKLIGDIIYQEMRRHEDLASSAAASLRRLSRARQITTDKMDVCQHRALADEAAKSATRMVKEVLQAVQFYSESFLKAENAATLHHWQHWHFVDQMLKTGGGGFMAQ